MDGKVDRDASVRGERKEPPMNKPEPVTTIVCHFPKDNCGYCKDGIPHRHRWPAR